MDCGAPEFLKFHHTFKLLCTTHIGGVGPKVIGSIPEGEHKNPNLFCKECLVHRRLWFIRTIENYVNYIFDDDKPVVERYWRGRPRLPQGLAWTHGWCCRGSQTGFEVFDCVFVIGWMILYVIISITVYLILLMKLSYLGFQVPTCACATNGRRRIRGSLNILRKILWKNAQH